MFNLPLEYRLFYNDVWKREMKNVKLTKLRKMGNQERKLFKEMLYNLFRIKAKTKPMFPQIKLKTQCISVLASFMKKY